MRATLLFMLLAATTLPTIGRTSPIQRDYAWEAIYTFEEVVRRARESGNMSYELTVFRDNNAKLHFEFNIDGAQTMERLKGDAQPDGNKLRLYVKGFGEDDATGKIK